MPFITLNALNIALAVVGLINLVLGLLILFRSKIDRVATSYLFIIASLLAWIVLSIVEDAMPADALSTTRLLYASGVFVAASFMYFTMVFPESHKVPFWNKLLIIGTSIGVMYMTYTTPAVIERLVIVGGVKQYVFGYGYWAFSSFIILLFALGFLVMALKIRSSSGIHRLQLKYVFFGYLIASLAGLTTDVVLPWFGYMQLISVGPLFSAVMVGFTYYAMLRYNLLQTRVVVVKTILYGLLIMTVIAFFALSILFVGRDLQAEGKLSDLLVIMVTSLIIVISLDPLKRLLARATDSVFYKDRIDYQALLRKVGEVISRQVSQEGLVYSIAKNLAIRLKIEYTLIFVAQEGNGLVVLGSQKPPMLLDNPLVRYISAHRDIVVTEELERIRDDTTNKEDRKLLELVVDELHAMNCALVAPMFSESKLVGIILLGQKRSGDIYTKEEIAFLEVVAPQIATALVKARLYDEAQQFNVKLKEEVASATENLRKANNRLKQLDQAKSEFLSIAAHQLRTPLTGIKGYVSMFLEGDFGKLTKEQLSELEKIFRSSDRLTRLVDVFLNVSRIETGRLELKKTKNKVEEVLDEVISDLKQLAAKKNLELTVQKPDESLPEMYFDRDKIHDVMMNLVDNAIKYTQKGWINVRISRSKSLLTFAVNDSGIGIAADEIDKLFQKFSRAEAVSRVHTGGSGLGLFIAKKIVEAHGGRIWAESSGEGEGSLFTFTLPIDEKGEDAEPEEK